MWPILYEHWTEDLPLTAEALYQRLAENVRPEPTYRQRWAEMFKRDPHEKPFEGTVAGDHFKIWRVIHYRNSFLPVIIGTIAPAPSGSRLTITMRLHPLVAVFMLFWFGGVGAGLFGIAFAPKHQPAGFSLVAVPLGMILFGVALTTISFEVERRKARKLLSAVLHA